MRLQRHHVVLTILAAAVIAGNWTVYRDYSQPNWEILPEMVHSEAYETYSENPVFSDGKTVQSPVPGTIPRGQMPLGFGPGEKEAERAGRELVSPLRMEFALPAVGLVGQGTSGAFAILASSAVRDTDRIQKRSRQISQRGAVIFKRFCAVCHGVGGQGDGPVTRRGVPPPPSLLQEKSVNMPDGRMFHVLTFGQGNMAPYAYQLSPSERWYVIYYVRSLQNRARRVSGGGK